MLTPDLISDEEGGIDLPERGGTHRVQSWEIEGWQKSEAWGHVNVRGELQKMQAWLMTHPKQQKQATRRFVVAWLNKAAEGKVGVDSSVAQTAYRDRVQRAHREEMSKPAARPEVARAALAEAMRILRS